MLAILANAPAAVMHKGKGKDNFDPSTLLLKVVPLLVTWIVHWVRWKTVSAYRDRS